MLHSETVAAKLASRMLAHNGVAVISDLHLAAAAAKGAGKFEMAASLVEIAEIAEQLWLARASAQAPAND